MTHTKAHHPPEIKRKTSTVSHNAHGCLSKKKRKGEKGEDDKSKSIDDGQVPKVHTSTWSK